MSDPAVQTIDLVRNYPGVRALKGVSITVPRGSTYALVGPNGSGKTTLFSVVCGFLKPTSGDVRVFGRNVREGLPKGLVSVLPQDARFMKSVPIVTQFVWYARLLGFSKADAEKEALRVLELVDLVDDRHKEGDELSHGMHKRMGIAQAFMGQPQLIMLDEPTAGLDPRNARTIRDRITELRGKTTIVVSSHNLAEIERICDDIAILKKGDLVVEKAMAEFTGSETTLTFTLPHASPDAELLQQFRAIDGVVDVVFDKKKKTLRFDLSGEEPSGGPEKIIPAIVTSLSAHQILFTDMIRGSRLEDQFIDAVEK